MGRYIGILIGVLLLAGCQVSAGDSKEVLPSDLAATAEFCEDHGGVRIFHIGGWDYHPGLEHRVTGLTCNDGVQFAYADFNFGE